MPAFPCARLCRRHPALPPPAACVRLARARARSSRLRAPAGSLLPMAGAGSTPPGLFARHQGRIPSRPLPERVVLTNRGSSPTAPHHSCSPLCRVGSASCRRLQPAAAPGRHPASWLCPRASRVCIQSASALVGFPAFVSRTSPCRIPRALDGYRHPAVARPAAQRPASPVISLGPPHAAPHRLPRACRLAA